MRVRRLIPLILAVWLPGLAGGCSRFEPFVLKTNEFDRDSPSFAKKTADIESVTICYNKYGTTPQSVLEIARNRCGEFEKAARFSHQDYLRCPLFTPVGAHFECVKP